MFSRVISAITITPHTGRKSSEFWRETIPSKLADSFLFLPQTLPILDPVKLSIKCGNIIKLFQNYKATQKNLLLMQCFPPPTPEGHGPLNERADYEFYEMQSRKEKQR